ncbi:MAG: ion channel [Chthoniobacterales bacterium]
MTDSETKHSVRRIYFRGLLLTIILFSFHTAVIFEMAYNLHRLASPLKNYYSDHLGGPLIIILCFFVLFITHTLEAAAWAFLFWRHGQFRTFGESMYFTGTSLTALGYGDVVLHTKSRGLGPVMATNGILMFGCSTAFLFFVIQSIWTVIR